MEQLLQPSVRSCSPCGYVQYLRLICLVLLPSGYVRVIQLVCLNLLPRDYVGAAYVLKICNITILKNAYFNK